MPFFCFRLLYLKNKNKGRIPLETVTLSLALNHNLCKTTVETVKGRFQLSLMAPVSVCGWMGVKMVQITSPFFALPSPLAEEPEFE